jgi:hypothetical protein
MTRCSEVSLCQPADFNVTSPGQMFVVWAVVNRIPSQKEVIRPGERTSACDAPKAVTRARDPLVSRVRPKATQQAGKRANGIVFEVQANRFGMLIRQQIFLGGVTGNEVIGTTCSPQDLLRHSIRLDETGRKQSLLHVIIPVQQGWNPRLRVWRLRETD